MRLIGIAGTNGSGKDTVSKMLADEYNFLFVSGSADLLIPELVRRGLPTEREQMSALSSEWRRSTKDGDPMIDQAVALFEKEGNRYEGLVVSSLRHPNEAKRVHELGGQVWWIDAEPKVRYGRIISRRQGVKDQKTFEQFLAEEQAEMTHVGDEATLNMMGVKKLADHVLQNDGELNLLKTQVEEIIGQP